MTNEGKNILLFLSHNDIPFPEAQISIHQPTLNEISLIGEEYFFNGLHFLNFKKERFFKELPPELQEKTDFEVMMMLLGGNQPIVHKKAVLSLLTLLFPNHKVRFSSSEILLLDRVNKNSSQPLTRINLTVYEDFLQIIKDMFCMEDEDIGGREYEAADGMAQRIVEKLRKGKEKIARLNNGGVDNSKIITLLASYVSILAIGKSISINEIMEYTVYQLKTEIKRMRLKMEHDIYISAKLAGAKDLQTPDDWMGTNIFLDNK